MFERFQGTVTMIGFTHGNRALRFLPPRHPVELKCVARLKRESIAALSFTFKALLARVASFLTSLHPFLHLLLTKMNGLKVCLISP